MANRTGSLQDLVDSVPNLADYFYENPNPPHASVAGGSPVPPEVTNWRDEQRAWRETAVLLDQTHHMPELFLSGPDARQLLGRIGVNSLKNLAPGRAKQFIGCTDQGYLIGDCILHDLGDERFELISGMPLLDWVHYNAESGGYDVTVERDHDTPTDPKGWRTNFRYQLAGPNAAAIFAELVGGNPPEIAFFRTAQVRIAGCDVLALRHSMSGHQGVELSGPYAHQQAVRDAIIAAGAKHGMLLGGLKSYFSTGLESGWMAYPLPAIYTDETMRGFREWLPGSSWEARMQLGGSFRSQRIEDYYSTPFDFGYGSIINHNHDFFGSEALRQKAQQPKRGKCTLVWNREDMAKVFASILGHDMPYKYFELPVTNYAFQQRDTIRNPNGDLVGLSCRSGYSANEGDVLSLAMIDETHLAPGTEVIVTWGEPDGGSSKPRVERHQQIDVRATVQSAPYGSANSLKRVTLAA